MPSATLAGSVLTDPDITTSRVTPPTLEPERDRTQLIRRFALTNGGALEVWASREEFDNESFFGSQSCRVRLFVNGRRGDRVIGEVELGVHHAHPRVGEIEHAIMKEWHNGLSPRWMMQVAAAMASNHEPSIACKTLHAGEIYRDGCRGPDGEIFRE